MSGMEDASSCWKSGDKGSCSKKREKPSGDLKSVAEKSWKR